MKEFKKASRVEDDEKNDDKKSDPKEEK
jgi:hypothetical protein